jgi:hypothetical protein
VEGGDNKISMLGITIERGSFVTAQGGEITLRFPCQFRLTVMRNMTAFWVLTLCSSIPIYQPTRRHNSDDGNTDTAGRISDISLRPNLIMKALMCV